MKRKWRECNRGDRDGRVNSDNGERKKDRQRGIKERRVEKRNEGEREVKCGVRQIRERQM